MTFTDQLQVLEQELKRLLSLDDAELQATIEQLNKPEWAAQASPQGYIAGALFTIEHACRELRERLHVQLSIAMQVEMSGVITDEEGNSVSRSRMIKTDSWLLQGQQTSRRRASSHSRKREKEARNAGNTPVPPDETPETT